MFGANSQSLQYSLSLAMSHDPRDPTMKASTRTSVFPFLLSHSSIGWYFVFFSLLAFSNDSPLPSYRMVTSMIDTFPSPCHNTKSGLRSLGAFFTFCSRYRSPSDSGIAFTSHLRMVLCLSLISPALGVQAFNTWPSVCASCLHFGQVVSRWGFPALLITTFVGSRFSLPLIANR